MAFVTKTIAASIAAALVGLTAACSTSPSLAKDTMPTNAENARQLAQTVASNGGCGSFEYYNFNRARDTWVFTCQKPGITFEIIAYGSREARSVGLKSLDDSDKTYFAQNFYAVVLVASHGNGSVDSALASFKR